MKRDDIEAAVRRIYATAADEAAHRALFSDAIVWHVPGDNPVSGAYRGPVAYFETMTDRMEPLEDWRFEVDNVLVNESGRAALVAFHVAGRRKGRRVDLKGFHMIRLDEAGRVVEGWGFSEDQAALDTFFSA